MLSRFGKVVLFVVAVILFVQALPDIRRYLQIRKM
jgi:hypothetical protein